MSARTGAKTDAKDRELRRVRAQLTELRDKDSRLEVRLARLEHALNLSLQTTAVAMAAETESQK